MEPYALRVGALTVARNVMEKEESAKTVQSAAEKAIRRVRHVLAVSKHEDRGTSHRFICSDLIFRTKRDT